MKITVLVSDLLEEVNKALKVHRGNTVEMEDREYSELKKGIERLRSDITTTTANLVATVY